MIAAWEPYAGDSGGAHRRWARSLSHVLASSARAGGYPNLLGPDEHEQIDGACGNNVARLRAVKERFDPDHVFSATPMPL